MVFLAIREDVFKYAKKRFGSEPEFLWPKDPSSAVLRNKVNSKWYAITTNISSDKLGIKDFKNIDILNVKCEPIMVASLVDNKRYFRAYHMNKEHWITIVLNENISKEEIFGMLDLSFEIVNKKSKMA